MDVLEPVASISDESSCDDSTGPTTPASSPLFRPYTAPKGFIQTPLSLFHPKPLQFDTSDISSKRSDTASSCDSTAPGPVRNICFIGAGYVGGPTAAVIALHNPSIRVEVLDRDPERIRSWQSPHPPIHEDGLSHVVRVARDGATSTEDMNPQMDGDDNATRGPNLFFTIDSQRSISTADIVCLAVNTPTKMFGVGAGRATNMVAVDGAVQDIARYARPGTIIVEKSTVPCGTAQRIRQMLNALRPHTPFEVLSNPEFLAEGSAIQNLMTPDRVIIGSSNTPTGRLAAAALADVYAQWVPRSRILEINVWSSELCKLVANAMLAQRISSINSISAICESTGADVMEIAKAVGQDVRIGPQFLKAGLGFGGSCFRKDIASLTYLAESLGLDEVADYWNQVNSMNDFQRRRFAQRVVTRLGGNLIRKKVALLGFAFKKNTGDCRESLAVDVIRLLLEERPSEIAIFDPFCKEEDMLREIDPVLGPLGLTRDSCPVKIHANPYQACSQVDAILVITDCDQFRNTPTKHQRTNQDTETQPLINQSTLSDSTTSESELCSQCTELELSASKAETFMSYQLKPQTACGDGCGDCKSKFAADMSMSTERVDWTRIAYNMKDPKWLFDGRAFLDEAEMHKLGIRMEAIGARRSEPTLQGWA